MTGQPLVIILLSGLLRNTSSPVIVDHYQTFFGVCNPAGSKQTCITLRKFNLQGTSHYLVVDPNDLSTAILTTDQVDITADDWDSILAMYENTAYIRALYEAEQRSEVIQDAGITRFSSFERGVNLTVDLCPSARPLDRELFLDLVRGFAGLEMPVPVAISVTGIWMEKHRADLDWLKDLISRHEIQVEWINHSYHHRYRRNLPLKKNFLLENGTDLNFEVLETEKMMIENGLLPSVFFRFPGLVSEKEIFFKIIAFGLIPIGSDAWLAKNQLPGNGSIILLHGNGNEPVGIKRFLNLLRNEKTDITKKRWLLYDLRESIENLEDSLQIKPKS
jgi:hypothetical protein